MSDLTSFSPTALEIRAVIYTAVVGVIFFWGYHVGSGHVRAEWNADKLTQATLVAAAQERVITAQRERDTLQTQVEEANAKLKAANDAAASALANSVHNLEAVVRAGALSAAVGHTPESAGAAASAGSDPEFANILGRANAAINAATEACLHDSRELAGILALQPQPQVTTK